MEIALEIDNLGQLIVSNKENNIEVVFNDGFIAHGVYNISNSGGFLVQISYSGDSVRLKDSFGSDNPKISDWFEIEYIPNEDGDLDEEGNIELIPVIDPEGYNVPLNMVMRLDNFEIQSKDFCFPFLESKITSEKDLIKALHLKISEGLVGSLNFEDFCSELGYDVGDVHQKKYQSCVKMNKTLIDVFGDIQTISKIYKSISKMLYGNMM